MRDERHGERPSEVEASAAVATHLAANRANVIPEFKTHIATNHGHAAANRGHVVVEVSTNIAAKRGRIEVSMEGIRFDQFSSISSEI
jgi:hypothetical protein